MPDEQTMTDRIGALHPTGDPTAALHTVVGAFYQRMLADEQLAGYFAFTDIARQQRRLVNALKLALGLEQRQYQGPEHLADRMKAAHHPLRISRSDFDATIRHLGATLDDTGVPQDIAQSIIDVAESLFTAVVDPALQPVEPDAEIRTLNRPAEPWWRAPWRATAAWLGLGDR